MPLDVLPTFVLAVLACWLGLTLLVRSPHDPPTRAFAWLCCNLTLYGLTSALAQLTSSADVLLALNRVQVVETVLLPPVWLHFVMVVADINRRRLAQRLTLALVYLVGGAMTVYALFAPEMLQPGGEVRFPAGPATWLWAAHRAAPLLLSLALVVAAYRWAHGDDLERRRRALFAVACFVGVAGALWSTVAREAHTSLALSHILWDAGLALLAYSVLVYRWLLPVRVAQRVFYRSLFGSVLTALYVGALLLLEPLFSRALQISAPLISLFGIVVLMALVGPLRDAAGAWLDRRFFHREFDYGQLLRAVSDDLFERGDLAEQLDAALAAICRTLSVQAGVVAVQEGMGLRVLAGYGTALPDAATFRAAAAPPAPRTPDGDWPPWPLARLLLPLRRGDATLGLLALGSKRSDEPYAEVERVLLDSLGRYLALAIRHARTQQEEELALAALTEQSRQLQAEQQTLAAQVAEAARVVAPARADVPERNAAPLRVYTLGPLRVEREGAMIDRWGGDKAGAKQSEALFAFLLDRRGRGLTKDEAEEVIWPDLDIEKADSSFHRTISALRRALEPGLRRGNESRTITYHHERYWLTPSIIAWADADEFSAAVEQGQTLARRAELEAALERLRAALALYRGDYMDDCPHFGDSSYVEQRRGDLRAQQVSALLTLGGVYERLHQPGEAATCYRRALAASQEECPRAEEGLARLQLA